MKLTEYLGDLDPNVAGKLEQAVQAIREEFDEKLAQTVKAVVEEATIEATEATQPSAPAPEPPTLSLDAADELRMAALDIDVAASQAEILEALSRGALRFASRVAIFVNRGDQAHGWSSTGFGDADARIKEVVIASSQMLPAGATADAGSYPLSADECGPLCDVIGADLPSMGLLMPFVLGNQVVGTVYCDRAGDDPFSVSALQLLTFVAGQTLETLPVRKRSSTATLSLAGSAPQAAEVAVAEPPPDIEPEVEPEAESVHEAVPEPEPEPAPEPEPEPEPRVDEASAEPAEDLDTTEAHVDVEDEYGREISGTVDLSEVAATVDPPAIDTRPEPAPSYGSALEAPPEDEATRPGTLVDEEAAGGVPVAAEPTLDLGSTEVSAPDDLEGPGWAFTAPTPASDSGSDADHEEAQRLARLLVTEIKLYNEEAVEEGRRSSNVYARLQEDIDRSRQIFEDRIDEHVRADNDYFKQALVRILAGGDPSLLGI